VELEDIAWVQAIGFDKGPSGFTLFTFEIGIPGVAGAPSAAGATQAAHHLTTTVVARSVGEAFDIMGVNLGRRVSLSHSQLFVLGEALARSDARGIIQALDRWHETRGSALVAVARGEAQDVLRVTVSPIERSPSRFIGTVMQQHQQTGLFETIHFARFVATLNTEDSAPTCPIIAMARELKPKPQGDSGGGAGGGEAEKEFPPTPKVGERISKPEVPEAIRGAEQGGTSSLGAGQVPHIGGGPVEIMGMAVFSGGQMVGEFGGEEARTLSMIRGDFERGFFSVPDPLATDQPQYSLAMVLAASGSHVEARRQGDRVTLHVKVKLEGSYLSIMSQTDYTDPRNTPLAEKAAEDQIKRAMDRAITRSQKEMKVDPFRFGDRVKGTFLTWPEFDKFAWQSKYPDATVVTEVEIKIRRYGLDLAPPRVPPSEIIRKKGG
jgi:Ger(x)C family germination protein